MTEISFIVPAFNEEALLPDTLRAIGEAADRTGESCEVIVVDDASTDGTARVAESLGARVVSVSCRHIAATRNAGAREAQGRWLIFVDADTRVTPAVVQAAVAALRAGKVGGGCKVHFEGRLPVYGWLLIGLVAPLYRGLGLAAGCFLFCTQAAFQAVGGFDETLYAGEEAFLSRSLRRHGRFVILREQVSTSGRKLRAHSGRELVGTLFRLAIGGRKAMSERAGLDIWYGKRRKDPG
jgi:glycosyltransferase involved in cell wall biosynthesis